MLNYQNIAGTAHATEDLFYFIRESKPAKVNHSSLSDLMLEVVDFMKLELEKIKNGDWPDQDEGSLIKKLKNYLQILKQQNASNIPKSFPGQTNAKIAKEAAMPKQYRFRAEIHFEEDCRMENVRAYLIIHRLTSFATNIRYLPDHFLDNDDEMTEQIRQSGFIIFFSTSKSKAEIQHFFAHLAFIKSFQVTDSDAMTELKTGQLSTHGGQNPERKPTKHGRSGPPSLINVNLQKLDRLLNLVGELVISETMVVHNPDLYGLHLEGFHKAARQLNKNIDEIQDIVLSIRMLPIGPTFFRMSRIVRDMKRKLHKEVQLKIVGEETEVDKTIIEKLTDPLIHLVRNALDHGVETPDERLKKGKKSTGTLTLKAQNAGNDVHITVMDDGQGLDREDILKKAEARHLLHKTAKALTNQEVYQLIFTTGFSTNRQVTEYSGRGVGMDIVRHNVEALGGSVQIDSRKNEGTAVTMKIPLTLAIIDGMNFRAASSVFTLPTKSIRECFRPQKKDMLLNTNGHSMIMIRHTCFPVINMRRFFHIQEEATVNLDRGMIIVLETEKDRCCLLVDELLGEQQIVVKSIPHYVRKFSQMKGIAGCTLLGNGQISLILDASSLTASM